MPSSSFPSEFRALKALLRADFTVQWRQRRALIMSILLPVIFVISWRSLIPEIGGAAVLAICIAVGLPSTGLMGYSQSIARDREKGVFQRLRTAPIPTWVIMTSRIIVQLAVILFLTLVTAAIGHDIDKIAVSPLSYVLLCLAGIVGGLSFIAIGQTVVAFIKSSDAVNAAVRLIYFPLAIVGALGEIGLFGELTKKIVTWSPFGTTQTLLLAAMNPHNLTVTTLWAFLATLAYGLFFAAIGIHWFQWNT